MNFVFNKCDILTLIKEDDNYVTIKYEHMISKYSYESKINLKNTDHIINDYDMLCKYLNDLKTWKKSPKFIKVYNSDKNIFELHIIIPFTSQYRKENLDLTFKLDIINVHPYLLSSIDDKRENDMLSIIAALKNKIISLESEIEEMRKIKYVYIIPYKTSIAKSSYTFTEESEILEFINKYALPWCKETYNISNSYVFKIARYDGKSNNSNSKCIMLFDSDGLPVEKYGCNFCCYYLLGECILIRIPTFKKINKIINQDVYDVTVNVIFKSNEPTILYKYHKSSFYAKNIKYLDNESFFLDKFIIKFIDNYNFLYIL